ncbi:MAG: glycosyltransferase [Candidatus Omnitrophota bacterium]|nr:glycosyltransferase [Candidatus Omnitrophota bacterium]
MKIFIVHAPAGAGHKKAAEAIKDAFDRAKTNHDVRVINSLDYTNALFSRSYPWGYNFLVSKAPLLWSFFFYLTDFKLFQFFMRPVRRLTNFINCVGFYRFIIRERPDCVISTHFLSTDIVSNLKALKLYEGKHITCVTDYGVHAFWIAKHVDNYVVASEYSKKELIAKGIVAENIRILGIPVQHKFTEKMEREAAIRKLGLKEGLFNILIIGGGLGVGPIPALVKVISGCACPFQLVVVCGNNKELVDELQGLAAGAKMPVKVYGFVENVNEFMDASDVMISKPGGLSLSEALVKGLPVLVSSYIAGHEEKNLRFLEKNNVGIGLKRVEEAPQRLQTLYASKDLLNSMKERAKQLGKPSAADDIALLALEMIKG